MPRPSGPPAWDAPEPDFHRHAHLIETTRTSQPQTTVTTIPPTPPILMGLLTKLLRKTMRGFLTKVLPSATLRLTAMHRRATGYPPPIEGFSLAAALPSTGMAAPSTGMAGLPTGMAGLPMRPPVFPFSMCPWPPPPPLPPPPPPPPLMVVLPTPRPGLMLGSSRMRTLPRPLGLGLGLIRRVSPGVPRILTSTMTLPTVPVRCPGRCPGSPRLSSPPSAPCR
jgi:hypothetical protein